MHIYRNYAKMKFFNGLMQPDNDIGVTETDVFNILKLKWLYYLIYIGYYKM